MDFRINREIICTNEESFGKSSEQSVELDYILPDYYPDIFRLVKCMISPRITSQSVSGDKLVYELCADITIWYCGEGGGGIRSITQKLTYSKTVDIGTDCENAVVKIKPHCDYVNCRAVNRRRVDVRGAITSVISVCVPQKQEVVSDAFGGNIQIRKKHCSAASERIFACRRFQVEDETDLGDSKPAVAGILRSSAVVTSADKKIVSGKLVAKGDISVSLLYLSEDGEIEGMQFSLPFSQIIDIDGADSNHECMLDAEAIGCDITAAANSAGENKLIKCSVLLLVSCSAQKQTEVEIATDAYSTSFRCETAASDIKLEAMPVRISELHSEKETLESDGSDIECIHGAWCAVESVGARAEGKLLRISGRLKWAVLVKTTDDSRILEKETVFEHDISDFPECDEIKAEVNACVISSSFSLNSSQSVMIKAEIRIFGCARPITLCSALTDIAVDADSPVRSESECALKLCFSHENDSIWDIAKRYCTSVSAVAEENDIDDEKSSGMLLIPMVSNR